MAAALFLGGNIMLEFIIGRAGSGKTTACLQAMRERLQKEPEGPALILLLPEHMTYKLERELAASLAEHGSGYIRAFVFGFRRFARQVLLETGGNACPRITGLGKRLFLQKILEQRGDELQAFGRAARQRGFAESLAGMIEEFKSCKVTFAGLQEAAGKLTDEALQKKLLDLSVLYEDFAACMQGRYNDTEDLLDTLVQKLPEAKLLEGAEIWIDGFVFFNPQEQQIVRELLLHAKHVHITLSAVPEQSKENQSAAGLFHRCWETLQKMKNLAADLGIEVRETYLHQTWRFRSEPLSVLESGMFAYPVQPHPGKEEGLRLVEAATRRLEAEAMAADILRLCREKGWHWRDIGILVRDAGNYGTMLEMVLQDARIPFFRDSKRASVHHPLAELVRSAFEVLHGWHYDAMFRCIKTDFFPVTREEADLLENYVLTFGIRGRRWSMQEDWRWRQHYSLEEENPDEISDEEELVLGKINLIRRKIVQPLLAFEQQVKASGNVREVTAALYDLLIALEIPEQLTRWADQAEQQGLLVEAREHRQIWADIMELMDQLVETSGEEQMKLSAYEAVLDDGLDALQISLIPPGLDYVTIADFDQNSLDNVRAVYILGANEGTMPRHSHEKGLLSDADRLYLNEAGIELPAGSMESSFAEKYLVYKGFTQARDYLWVSYALADAEGGGLSASPLIHRLRTLLPEADFLSIPLESLERQDALLLARGRQAVSGLAAAFRGYREKHKLAGFWQDVYNWALADAELRPVLEVVLQGLFAQADAEQLLPALAARLYTKKHHLRGSVTRFESFRACPFRHFAQYGLKLRERREYRFQAPDLGTLLHGTLKDFGEKLKAEGRRWSELDEAECHAICGEIIEKLAPRLQNEILLSTAQYQNLLQRIRKTAEAAIRRLIAFDRVSVFHPEAFERSFGQGPESMPPLVYGLEDGFSLEISGQVDRIDLDETGKYFLVIDYKTGNAYINLLEVYYGLRMQLLTYLLVTKNLLERTEERPVFPAGLLYYFLKNPLLTSAGKISAGEAKKEIAKQLRMPGWVLADPEVIQAIDSSLTFIKVALKQNGEIYARSRGSVKTEEEFGILLDYISYVLADTGQTILHGEIAAAPYQLKENTACRFCSYHAVCGFDLQVPGFAYRRLEEHEEAELMDTMEIKGKGASACSGQMHN